MTSPDTGRAGEVETRIALPWPDRVLSPNGRSHWATKARAVKSARRTAYVLTLEALRLRKPAWEGVALHWEFHPKTRNGVDSDNAESSVKAYRDGIADALGIDDGKFQVSRSFGEPIKGGAVIVTVRSV
jgi:crossover junction endodeoxyribonuclease RusA